MAEYKIASNQESLSESELEHWLIKTRREFHQHPELGFQEVWTTTRIAEILSDLSIEVQLFDDMTGVVGLLRFSDDPGPCIGLRADIDALPIEELNTIPYKSINPGCMHACGHDAHTTIMLGVAKQLVEFCTGKESSRHPANNLKGSVKFLFQPAEENGPGSQPMIDRGVLSDPDVDTILACHVTTSVPVGKVESRRTVVCASADSFEITITGTVGHAASPHRTRDPIIAGANLVNAMQTIVSRNIDPMEPAVISIASFQAGSAVNIIPEKAVLQGTIRAMSPEVRELLHKRIKTIATEICKSLQVKADVRILEGYPPTINDPKIAEFLHQAAVKTLGQENVKWAAKPSVVAEDFSFFAMAKPSALMWLGAGSKNHLAFMHAPYFDIDENVLLIGVNIITRAVKQFLMADG
jgi:amidohydrolase